MSEIKEKALAVSGSGGGGGKGGAAGGGTIAQNTLQSNTVAQIIEMLGEGPIAGLLAGAQSIYFNETPLQNADGSSNFGGLFVYVNAGDNGPDGNPVPTSGYYPVIAGTVLTGADVWLSGVSFDTRLGTPDQDVLLGFPSSQTTTTVNEQIQNSIGPIIRTIEDTDTTSVLVTIGIPNLSTLDPSTGNLNGASVGWTIDVAPYGGAYVNQVNIQIINQKCTSLYLHQSSVTLPAGGAPWNIRVTRTTSDNLTDINIQSQTFWESYTEVVQGQLTYPNTALVSLSINSQFFGSTIPTRGYLVGGLICDVPSNYDPVARTYTGIWDGTFKSAWHNNPAWVLYALITNNRWGLGEFIDPATVDKWGLYAIGQYCDEMIPSGFQDDDNNPILEPRFTYNGVINNRQEAFKVLQGVAAAFRGMAFWSLGQVFASADMPTDAITTVAPANVLNGAFNYSGTAMKSRHSVAAVSWNDPQDFYRPAIELVQSDAMIQLFGWRQVDVACPGCTSRGQALRYGKWILDTEQFSTETVEFTMSWDSYVLDGGKVITPGAVINVADPRKTGGARIGGRLKTVTSNSVLVIDAPFVPTVDDSYTLTVLQPDGTLEEQPIGSFDSTNTILTLSTPLAQTPQVGAMWLIAGTDVNPRQYRVLQVQEQDAHLFKITALFYDPTKFARVEENITLSPPTYTRPSNIMAPPSNPSVVESSYFINGAPASQVTLSWTQPTASIAASFNVSAIGPSGPVNFGSTSATSVDLLNVTPGNWVFYITAVSVTGLLSTVLPYAYTVAGWSAITVPTAGSLALATAFTSNAPTLTWANTFPSGAPSYALINVVRVYDTTTNVLLRTVNVTGLTYTYSFADNLNDGGPRRSLKFTVTAKSLLGVEQATPATITVTNPQLTQETPVVTCSGLTLNASWSGAVSDYGGAKLWISAVSGFDPTVAAPAYIGPNSSYSASQDTPGMLYIRLGVYDVFGTDGITICPEVAVYCAGINYASMSAELADAITSQNQLLADALQQTQGAVAAAAAEQDAANWLDKYNIKDILTSNYATLSSVATAIAGAITTAETNASTALAAYETTASATFATLTGLSTATATAISTAELSAAASLASYVTTVTAAFATTNGNVATNAAALSTLTSTVTTLSSTLTANYTTTTGMNTAIATSLTTAESFATGAVAALSSSVSVSLGNLSAGGTFQIVASAGTSGALAQVDMQVSASMGATFANAGIEMAAYVDLSGNPYSQLRFYADQTQIGVPGVIGGGYVTPFSVSTVNGTLQMALSPTMLPDASVNTNAIASGAVSAFTTVTGSNVVETILNWNNSGAGAPVLSVQLVVAAGSALIVDFETVLNQSADSTSAITGWMQITCNGTLVRQINIGAPAYDFSTPGYGFSNFPVSMRQVIGPSQGLVAGINTVLATFYRSGTDNVTTITAVAPQFILEEQKNASVTVGVSTVPTPSVTYIGTTVGGTSCSFTSASIGTANAYRMVVVGLGWYSTTGCTPAMTIGGNPATLLAGFCGGNYGGFETALFALRVPTGTTADIVASGLPTGFQSCVISVWDVIALNATPSYAFSDWSYDPIQSSGNYHQTYFSYSSLPTQVLVAFTFGVSSMGTLTSSWAGTDTLTKNVEASTTGTYACHYAAFDMTLTQSIYSSGDLRFTSATSFSPFSTVIAAFM